MESKISDLGKFVFVDKLDPYLFILPSFVEGELKEEFLKEFNYHKKRLGDPRFLNVFKDENGILTGSNAPSIILANHVLGKYGVRTVGIGDIPKIKNNPYFNLNCTNVDLGFLVMSFGNPNKDIFRDFKDDLIKKKYVVGSEPILVYPWEISLKKNIAKDCGLSFKLKPGIKLRYFDSMDQKNNGRSIGSFTDTDFNFNRNGRIKFLASPSGLTRITLENNTFLRANRNSLMYSNHFYKMILTRF